MKIERVKIRKNGKLLTQTQVASIIRKELHLSKNKYQKLYDITRNKLRNYERITGAKPQSTLKFLYNRATFKQRLRYENNSLVKLGEKPLRYRRSFKAQFIESFTSKSTGRTTYTQKELEHINYITEKHINKVYGDLIEKNEYAKKIVEKFKDPVQRLKALNSYTEKRNNGKVPVKSDRRGRKTEVPFGSNETVGTNGNNDKQYYDDVIKEHGGSSIG